ncbi:MAG: HYR domain-containing protein, partial [Flavobacteriales bacterium]
MISNFKAFKAMMKHSHSSLIVLLLLLVSISGVGQVTYTWNGSTSTVWSVASNWTPAGVPTVVDNVILNINAGNLPVMDGNNAIANLTLSNATTLNLGGFTLTAEGNVSITGNSQLNNGALNVASSTTNTTTITQSTIGASLTIFTGRLLLTRSTFNGVVNATKSGGTNDDCGGNVFNAEATITNAGTAYIAFSNIGATFPDVFNANATFNNIGTSDLYIAHNAANNVFNGVVTLNNQPTTAGRFIYAYAANGATNTQFNNDIILNNTNGGVIQFGTTSSSAILASGRTMSIGSIGFDSGIFTMRNFTQLGTAAQTLNFLSTGTARITLGPTVTWNGAVSVTAPRIFLNGGTYNGNAIFTKTGAGNDNANGGQTFNGTCEFINNGSGYLGTGFTNPDIWNGDLTLTNTSSERVIIGWQTVGNQLNGNLIINSTGTGGIQFCGGNATATATLAAGRSITVGSLGLTAGFVTLEGFIQLGTVPVNLTMLPTGGFMQVGPRSQFNAAVTITAPGIRLNGATYASTSTFTKTGASNDNGAGNNTFNGVCTITNNGTGYFGLGWTTRDIWNADVYFNSNGNERILPGWNTANNEFNGNVYVSTAAGTTGINFCNGVGTASATIAAGRTIFDGPGGNNGGYIIFTRVTQLGTVPINLNLGSAANYIQFGPATTIGGALTVVGPRIILNQSTFNGATNFTKTGGVNDANFGGNTFNGACTITTTGAGYFGSGWNSPDIWNSNLILNAGGTERILLGWQTAGNQINGDLFLNTSGSTQGIHFCGGAAIARITLASGRTVSAGTGGLNTGYAILQGFIQLGTVPVNLTMASTGNYLQFGPSSQFAAPVTASAPGILLNGATYAGTTNFTKTGASGDNGSGNNVFNGVCTLTNNGSGYFALGWNARDIWNADVYFNINGSERIIPCWNTANNQFNGNVYISTNGSAVGFHSCGGSGSANATIAAGRTVFTGPGGMNAGYVILSRITQLGSVPINLTMSGTGNYLQYGPGSTFGGNVTSVSPGLLFFSSTFNGTTTCTKNGASDNDSPGGNTFVGNCILNNSGNGRLLMGNGNRDVWQGTATFNNSGANVIYLAHNHPGQTSTFAGTVTANNTSGIFTGNPGAGVRFAEGTSNVTFNGPVFTNNGGDGINNFILFSNGGAANTIIFNGAVNAVQNGTGTNQITYFGNFANVQFNANVQVSNTAPNTSYIGFGMNGGGCTMAAGNTISIGAGGFSDGFLYIRRFTQLGTVPMNLTLTGTDTQVQFGPASNIGGNVTVVSPGIWLQTTTFNGTSNFTQNGAFDVSSPGGNTFIGTCEMSNVGNGHFLMGNGARDIWQSQVTFNNTGDDVLYVAHNHNAQTTIFNGPVIVNNTSPVFAGNPQAGVRFNQAGATAVVTFNNTVTINNGGAGVNNLVAFNAAGISNITNFNGLLTINQTCTGSDPIVQIGNSSTINLNANVQVNNTSPANSYVGFSINGGATNLAAGRTITVGGSGFSSGRLIIRRFNQLGGTGQILNLTGTARVEIQANSVFSGNITVNSPQILLDNSTYNGISRFVKTGATDNNSGGGNIFNGNASFINTSTGNFVLSFTTGDDYNALARFVQRGTGLLRPAFDAVSRFSGNISTDSTTTAIVFGADNNGVVLIDGNSVQNFNGDAAFIPVVNRLRMLTSGTGSLNLNVPVINGVFTNFVTGNITTSGTNYYQFNAAATHTGASNQSHINGLVRRLGTGAFTYPVGDGVSLNSIGLNLTANATGMNVRYRPIDAGAGVYFGGVASPPNLTGYNTLEHWDVAPVSSATGTITLNWNSYRDCGVTDLALARVGQRIGGNWRNEGGTATTGSLATGSTTSLSVNTWGLVTMGLACPNNVTVNCPTNVTVSSSATACNANVTLPLCTASDGGATITITNDYNSGGANASGVYPVGVTVVTFTAVSSNGGSSSCSMTVTVVDNVPPVVTVPSNITVNTGAGMCGAPVNYNVSATDNCYSGCTTPPPTFPGFNYIGQFGQNYYYRSTTAANWGTANTAAQAVGAHLVTVGSAAENAFLAGQGLCWMGLTDFASEGNWTWVTGEPVIFTSWAPGEPNNGGGQNFGLLNWSGVNWDDQGLSPTNSASYPYIIELECVTPQLVSGLPSGSVFPIGTTTVTYNATDVVGNVSPNTSFTVTVVDNINPTIICQPDITIPAGSSVFENFESGAFGWTPSTNEFDASITGVLGRFGGSGGTQQVSKIFTLPGTASKTVEFDLYRIDSWDGEQMRIFINDVQIASFNPIANASGTVGPVSWTSTYIGIVSPNAFSGSWNDGLNRVVININDGNPTLKVGFGSTLNQSVPDESYAIDNFRIIYSGTGGCEAPASYSLPIAFDNCSSCAAAPALTGFTTLGLFNGKAYYLSDAAANFANANAAALALNGSLASIENASQNTSIRNLVDAIAPGINYMIGYNDAATEGTFVWSTGQPTSYINWPPGEPNGGAVEDATIVGPLGTWFDINPANASRYIIQVPCGLPVTLTSGLASGSTFPLGVNPVTFSTTDAAGNVSTCTFNVNVVDQTNPTITCPSNITAFTSTSACNASVAVPNPTTADNCAVTRLTWSMTGATTLTSPTTGINNLGTQVFNAGVTTVTYVVADAAGNSATCSFTVTITDNVQPVFTCPANTTVNVDPGTCTASVNIPNAVVTDNCGVVTLTWALTGATFATSPTTGINNPGTRVLNLGVTTLTFTATDAAGNIRTCSYTITVTDNIAPTVTCPANISTNTGVGSCVASIVTPNPTTADNCGVTGLTWALTGATIGASTTTGINNLGTFIFNSGVTTVTYTVRDAVGNTNTCSYTVTVLEAVPPTITCLPNITVNASATSCNANVTVPQYVNALTQSTCVVPSPQSCGGGNGQATTGITISSGQTFWYSTTGTLNTLTMTGGTLNVCGSLTVNTFNYSGGTINIGPGATMVMNGGGTITLNGSAVINNHGSLTINRSVTLQGGSANFIHNAVGATLSFGAGRVLNISNLSQINNNGTFNAPVLLIQGGTSGTIICQGPGATFNVGNLTNNTTNSVTSTAGQSCFVVTGTVTLNNELTSSSNLNVCRNAATPTSNWGAATVSFNCTSCTSAGIISDNCSLSSITNNFNNTNNASGIYPVGTTAVVWTVTDASGNTATCTQNITVVDVTIPTISCPSNITATVGAGSCTASVVTPNPTTNDNCGVTVLTWALTGATTGTSAATGINNLGTFNFNPGVTTVTYTARDAAGNTVTCNYTVTVSDNILPTVTCPANMTANVGAGTCTASVVTPNPTTGDNCAVTTLTWALTGATTGTSAATGINNLGTFVFNLGTTTVTYTVRDAAGNSATCSYTVTVSDNILPTITCPANITANVGAGTCTASVVTPNPTTGDNCGVTVLTWALSGATTGASAATGINNLGTFVFNVGTTTVTYTVRDAAGNTATCSYTVTVSDNILPTVTCPANITANVGAGTCTASVVTPNPTTGDNCGVIGLTWALTGATTGTSAATGINNLGTFVFNVGTTTVTYTVRDAAGNTATCSYTVIVSDNILPTITCPANITATVTAGACNRSVVTPNPTTGDNCGVTTLTWALTGATTGTSAATGINNLGTFTFNVGTTTVTYTVRDAANNVATCSYTVTITDNIVPSITCPSNITANVGAGTCVASVTVPNPTTSDNCGIAQLTWLSSGATVAASPVTGINNIGTRNFNVGVSNITYFIVDINGLVNTCTFTITVTDNILPTVTCPANITANVGAGTCTASVVTPNPTTGDNCGVTSLTWALTGATTGASAATGINNLGTFVFNAGVTTVTYTVRDAAGNTSNCSYTVTVNDNILPTVSCQDATLTLGITPLVPANASISGVINTYAPVSAIGTNTVTIGTTTGASTPFAAGNKVLLIQMKGASYNTSDNSLHGDISSLGNAGNYEFSRVVSVAGNVITLQQNIVNSYDIAGVVQLVRIPEYANATVTATLTALDWNGATGGILAFDASGTLTMNANISVQGNGFRGGAVSTNFFDGCPGVAGFVYPSPSGLSGQKGESISLPQSIASVLQNSGRGKIINGGGGGNDANAGGGGGSNAGAGGNGGFEWNGCGSIVRGGIAGVSLLSQLNNGNRLFLGGGGGGGHQNNGGATAGGDGGGIVVIHANSITPNGFSISARGDNALNAANDGAGAGGAGGSILISTNIVSAPLVLNAAGGNGGNTSSGHGPGAGGGGGYVWHSGSTLPTNISTILTGGNAGTDATSSRGSTAGSAGATRNNYVSASSIFATLDTDQVVVSTNDNCGISTISVSPNVFDCSDIGPNTVTVTVTDVNGNVATCTATVTVTETVPPTITCPANITANVGAGTCTASVVTPNPTTGDNCAVTTLTWALTGATTGASAATGINNLGTFVFNVGTTTVTYTVRDAANNVATCSYTVTVSDNILPTVTCPANITANVGAGTCTASVVTPNPTTGDNCAVTTLTWALTGATTGASAATGI